MFDGHFKTFYGSEEFEVEITIPESSLKIKGLSKNLLIEKKTEIQKEHAIYILEGPLKCYVGKSTDVQTRINTHKSNNKSEFTRCFILSKNGEDLRQYLDYMEAYAIFSMEFLGYELANSKKPNPNDDILNVLKKDLAKAWIDEFLSFLPILGFTKSAKKTNCNIAIDPLISSVSSSTATPVSAVMPIMQNAQVIAPATNTVAILPQVAPQNNKIQSPVIVLKLNGVKIEDVSSAKVFIKFLEGVGLETILNNCGAAFCANLRLSSSCLPRKKGSHRTIRQNNKDYYLFFNLSRGGILGKIKKIKNILNLDLEVIDPDTD